MEQSKIVAGSSLKRARSVSENSRHISTVEVLGLVFIMIVLRTKFSAIRMNTKKPSTSAGARKSSNIMQGKFLGRIPTTFQQNGQRRADHGGKEMKG